MQTQLVLTLNEGLKRIFYWIDGEKIYWRWHEAKCIDDAEYLEDNSDWNILFSMKEGDKYHWGC